MKTPKNPRKKKLLSPPPDLDSLFNPEVDPKVVLSTLSPGWRADLLHSVTSSKKSGYTLEDLTRFDLPRHPELTKQHLIAAWEWIERGLPIEPSDEPVTYQSDPYAYLQDNATPEELKQIEPPASLSIWELYQQVKARVGEESPEHFFAEYPRYLEAIRWRLIEGWTQAEVLAYISKNQPITINHIRYAAQQSPILSCSTKSQQKRFQEKEEAPPQWSQRAQQLIDWFLTARPSLPQTPFQFTPAIFVENPAKFYDAKKTDIEAGPGGCRADILVGFRYVDPKTGKKAGCKGELQLLQELFATENK